MKRGVVILSLFLVLLFLSGCTRFAGKVDPYRGDKQFVDCIMENTPECVDRLDLDRNNIVNVLDYNKWIIETKKIDLFSKSSILRGEVLMSIDNVNTGEGSLDIGINLDDGEPVYGFQFMLEGLEVDFASNGLATASGMSVFENNNIIMGVSLTGTPVTQSGVLVTIGFSNYDEGDPICFDLGSDTNNDGWEDFNVLSNYTASPINTSWGECYCPSAIDECGICGGDGSSCEDCEGVPNGDAVVDECGVCGGDSSSCADCSGVPNGDAVEDDCGTCDSDPTNNCTPNCGIITDTSGNEYNTVVIKNDIEDQCWLQSNLRTTMFANGDSIPGPFSDISESESSWWALWESQSPGYDIHPAIDPSMSGIQIPGYGIVTDPVVGGTLDPAKYGYHYNYWARHSPKGLCPTGWHIPNREELEILFFGAGGYQVASTCIYYLPDPVCDDWSTPCPDCDGTECEACGVHENWFNLHVGKLRECGTEGVSCPDSIHWDPMGDAWSEYLTGELDWLAYPAGYRVKGTNENGCNDDCEWFWSDDNTYCSDGFECSQNTYGQPSEECVGHSLCRDGLTECTSDDDCPFIGQFEALSSHAVFAFDTELPEVNAFWDMRYLALDTHFMGTTWPEGGAQGYSVRCLKD